MRFTTQGDKLYCFCLGRPEGDVKIRSLDRGAATGQRKIESVRVLGCEEKLTWTLEDDALRIQRPEHRPSELTLGLEIG
ncbi:MAG TPA: hypothetical protein VMJ75_22060 [Candidatus Acidoferrales bacterium]|nr:hypothetical protein [Candidatus Acidoferrales bacterium]